MFFGLFGCRKQASSAEEAALQYLNNKYNGEFAIESLNRKSGSGPFANPMYTGYAYEKSQPGLQFNIWVSADLKQVYDSYSCIEMASIFDEWFTRKANKIWPGSMVHAQIRLLSYSENLDYTDAADFYANESADNILIVCIPDSTSLSEMESDVCSFFEELGTDVKGSASFYILDCESMDYEDIYSIPDSCTSRWDISLGANKEYIANIFSQQEAEND